MGSRQLVVAVETTGAVGASWPLLFSEYVEKIIRAFAEESSTENNASTPGMMAMVSFNSHADRYDALFQQSPWTSRVDVFLGWLNSLNFNGGDFGDVAVAEALAEALWMCCPGPELPDVTQQKHCLLIATSEPHRISRRVVRPLYFFNSKGQREYQGQDWWSANAQAVSKAFPACQVSLSVIAPRQLASLRSIYNGARRNPRAAESGAEVSNRSPNHLILISEDFSEGKRAFSRAVDAHSSSGQVGNLLTSLGSVTSGIAGMFTGSGLSTMVGGTSSTNAIMNPSSANTNLVSPAGSNQSGLSAPPHQGPIPVSGASQALESNPSRVPDGTTSAVASVPGIIVQGPVTSGTAGTNAGSELREVVANANTNPMANTNLVTPAVRGLGSNQSGISAPPLQGIPVSGRASQAQSNPSRVPTTIGGTTTAIAMPGIVQGPVTRSATAKMNARSGLRTIVANANMNPMANTNLVTRPAGSNQLGLWDPPLHPGVATGPISVSARASQAQSNPFGVSAARTGAVATPSVNAGVHVAVNVMPPTSGLPQAVQSVPPLGPLALSIPVVTRPQQPSGASLFAKLWEGQLIAEITRKVPSKIVPICKLEAYRRTSASERLAADWLPTIQLACMVSQQEMHKEYRGPPENITFRLVTQHGILLKMAEMKMCAVIQLPSQTLILTSTDKCDIMEGMLFQRRST